MRAFLNAIFGARGQIGVGVLMVAGTLFQAWYWGFGPGAPPASNAIFWLSIEALMFAAYAVFSTALGYRATERVEQAVVENLDVGGDVDVAGDVNVS